MNYTNVLLVILIPILLYMLYQLWILAELMSERNKIEAEELELLMPTKYEKQDPLFNDVVRLTNDNVIISTTLLQDTFDIGYVRACRILDQLEEAGIVTESLDDEPRKVIRKVSIN